MMMWYGGDWGWGGWILMTVANGGVLGARDHRCGPRHPLSGWSARHRRKPIRFRARRAPRACSLNASLAARSTRTSIDSACRYCANTRDLIGCWATQSMVS